MKRILFLGVSILLTSAINAQVIFSGVSPASIAGNYELTYGEPTSGWGSDDLMDPANAVLGELALYDDANNYGCLSASNPGDLAGKIAVLYRGDCEFGLKGLNAEQAGAIACVIINNEPGGPIPMAAGASGELINSIPVVMISDVDGAALVAAMDNEPVTVFIGNKAGYYEYDLGIKASEILRPVSSSIPLALVENGGEFPIEIETTVYNYGSEDQADVTLQAIIVRNGDTLYNETSPVTSIASGDFAVLGLSTYNPTDWIVGDYTLKYIVHSSATDEYEHDNEIETPFKISSSVFTYASYNEDGELNSTGGSQPAEPGNLFSQCIYFRDQNASRLALHEMSFSAMKANDNENPSIEGEEFFLRIVKWNDNFVDMNDVPNPIGSYEELVLQSYTMETDASGEVVTAPFDVENQIVLEDNQRYLFCVTTYNGEIFLGTDGAMTYAGNHDHYLQPLFPIEIGSGSFRPYGFSDDGVIFGETVPSIAVSFIDPASVSLQAQEKAIRMNAYPNPASDALVVDFNKNEVSKVELVSIAGQLIESQNVSSNVQKTTFDVSNVENGVYIVKVTLNNDLTHTMRVVVSR